MAVFLACDDRPYSRKYENKSNIEHIIGIKLPKFSILKSKLVHYQKFDFEFEVQSTIKFNKLPDKKFFQTLDSICSLPMPEKPEVTSSYFYYSLESINRCWRKDGDSYHYYRNTDFGESFLHSKDAYFEFTITKGSKKAEMKYGNY
jgi:hypothetical protein